MVVIKDIKNNKLTNPFSGSRTIPLEIMSNMKADGINEHERGKWCKKYYTKTNYTQSRKKIIEDALLMALEDLLLIIKN